jgi:hypothetical protein
MKKSQPINTLDNIVINENIDKFIKSEKNLFVSNTQEKMNEIIKKSMPSLEKILKKLGK